MSYKSFGTVTRQCAICNKDFIPYKSDHLHCSKACYMRYHRKINRQNSRKRRLEKRKLIYLNYGNKCNCCGESNFKFLTIDHVNNDGYLETSKASESFLNRIIKQNYPKRFQVLCMNCNFGKKYTGVCPHNQEVANCVI